MNPEAGPKLISWNGNVNKDLVSVSFTKKREKLQKWPIMGLILVFLTKNTRMGVLRVLFMR